MTALYYGNEEGFTETLKADFSCKVLVYMVKLLYLIIR